LSKGEPAWPARLSDPACPFHASPLALEDAAAHVDTAAVVADQSHIQDAQNHAANGWIL
jgi:hypothetical protein